MIYIIVNPASKTGTGIKLWREIKPALNELNIQFTALKTTKVRGADVIMKTILNKDSSSKVTVIILGGDGTINEALQGISINDFERVRIGYLPTGSSNDLARDLGITTPTRESLKHLVTSNAYRDMDLGLLTYNEAETPGYTKRYFITSAGIGYDAAVCHETNSSRIKNTLNRLHLGKLSYFAICLKQLLQVPKTNCEIITDSSHTAYNNCYFVSIMNHSYQGGGIRFCPDAVDNDGLLNTCHAYEISKLRVLYTLPFAFNGNHIGMKGIHTDVTSKVRILFDEPLWVHTDGEVKTKATDITVECKKELLKFIV